MKFISFIRSMLFVSAALTVNAAAPSISFQPKDQTVILYQPAAFGVIVSSDASRPLYYQWRKDGVPITGATNDQIVLAHPQFSDAGHYSVVVSNSEGSVTSPDATLTVKPPKGGDLDYSFTCVGSIDVGWTAVAVQPNGKILINGGRGGIARLNANGTIDHTFMNGLSGAVCTKTPRQSIRL